MYVGALDSYLYKMAGVGAAGGAAEACTEVWKVKLDSPVQSSPAIGVGESTATTTATGSTLDNTMLSWMLCARKEAAGVRGAEWRGCGGHHSQRWCPLEVGGHRSLMLRCTRRNDD